MVESLGRQIVDGAIAMGTVVRLEDLVAEYGVSRSAVRDAITILQSMGLVEAKRSVGVTVLGECIWHEFNPDVIRWKLSGPHAERHMAALVELRLAVEPLAAGQTARSHPEAGRILQQHAAAMRDAAHRGDLEGFLTYDLLFHQCLLHHCDNAFFRYLEPAIQQVVSARHERNMMPNVPRETAVVLHELVALAIADEDATTAENAMRSIVDEVRDLLHVRRAEHE